MLTPEAVQWLSEHCRSSILMDSELLRSKALSGNSLKQISANLRLVQDVLSALEKSDE